MLNLWHVLEIEGSSYQLLTLSISRVISPQYRTEILLGILTKTAFETLERLALLPPVFL